MPAFPRKIKLGYMSSTLFKGTQNNTQLSSNHSCICRTNLLGTAQQLCFVSVEPIYLVQHSNSALCLLTNVHEEKVFLNKVTLSQGFEGLLFNLFVYPVVQILLF